MRISQRERQLVGVGLAGHFSEAPGDREGKLLRGGFAYVLARCRDADARPAGGVKQKSRDSVRIDQCHNMIGT